MATYSIKAPNGKTYQIEGPDGATQDQVIAAVLAQHPDAGQPTQASAEPKRAGVVDSLLRGGEQLVSDVYSGAKGAFGDTEEAAEGGARRRQQIGERYGEGASLAGLLREYEQNGLGAAAARAVTDIPKIVAESVPELGVAAAGGAAGAKLGAVAAPFLGPAAPLAPVVGGGLGALAASMVPSYGRMITSQAEADAERGEKTSIDQGKAVAAAGADAALNVIGGAGQLGKNLVKSLLGIKTAPATASKMADAALLKRAQQTLTGTVARGSARGVVAEMPTEVAQTVVERWQAGKALTGDDAYAEYGESMYGGALGGAGVGGPANIVDRSQARGALEDKEAADKRQRFLDRQEPAPEYDLPTALGKAKELQTQLNALRAEKVAKPADDIEKARNKQIDAEIKAVQDELRPVAQFIAKNRKDVPQPAAEETEAPAPAPAVDPNDALLESLGMKVKPVRQAAPETVRMQGLPGIEQEPEDDTSVAQYANDQAAGARNTGVADVTDYLRFLMRDPEMARRVADERPLIEGLDRNTTNALYGALKLQFKEQDKAAAREAKAQPARRADLLSNQSENPLAGVLEQNAARREQESAARAQGTEATNRTRERMATVEGEEQDVLDLARQADVDAETARNQALDQRTEQLVDGLVGALPQAPETTPTGRIVRSQRTYRDMSREELMAQLEVARATRNREQVAALVQELKDQRRPQTPEAIRERMQDAQRRGNTALATQLAQELRQAEMDAQRSRPDAPASDLAAAMGSKLPEGYADTNATNRAVSGTIRAFARMLRGLNDYTKAARERDLVGAPEAMNTADEAGREVQQRLAEEVNARRAAQGQAAMTQAEAIKLADRVAPLLKELRERWSAYTEPRVGAQGAQMRANKIVRGATPGSRPEPGQRAFSSPAAAAGAIQEQLGQIVDSFVPESKAPERNTPAGGARVAVPAELQLSEAPRESRDPVKNAKDFVTRLADTPGREVASERVERSAPPTRSKDLKDLRGMLQEPTERMVSETQPADAQDLALLQRAAELLRPGQDDDAQFIREQAQRHQQGLPVSRRDLQDYISLQEQGQRSDGGQRELFDRPDVATERTTPQRFAKYLDSQEVQALRRRLAKDLAQTSKDAAAAKEDVRDDEVAQRKAEVRLAQARAAAQRKGAFVEKWVDDIYARLDAIDNAWDRLSRQRDEVQTDIDDANAQTVDELGYMGNEDALAEAQKALEAWRLRKNALLSPVLKDLDTRIQALDKERGDLFGEMYRDEPLLTAAETAASKARREQSIAQRAADAVTREENKKARLQALRDDQEREAGTSAESRRRAAAQRAREGMGLPGTRVTRDTTAKVVERKAKGLKSKIGSLNEEVSKAWTAGDDARAAEFEAQREQAMSELAAVFQDAPRLRTEILDTAAERKAFEEYEAAQRELQVREAEERSARGEAAPALGPRRKGAVVRKQSAAPATLRTASKESLSGANKTDVRRPVEQSGSMPPVDRNDADYQAQANRIAAEKRAEKIAELRRTLPMLRAAHKKLTGVEKARLWERVEATRRELDDLEVKEAVHPAEQAVLDAESLQERARIALDTAKEKLRAVQNSKNLNVRTSASLQAARELVQTAEAEYEGARRNVSNALDALAVAAARATKGRTQARDAAAVERELAKAQQFEVDDEDALFQRGQETAGDALSDTAVEALEADNVVAALNNVAQKSKTPINQAVAKRLRGLLTNTTVVLDPDLVGPDGEPAFGAAAADGLRIYLNPSKGLNEETLLHEGVHAATERVLQMPESELTPEQLAAKRELQALHAAAKRDPDITSVTAKDSLSEFAAEALSNPVLQQQLARKPWKLQNAWEGFKRVLLKLLGVDGGPPGDMLTATLAAVDSIMQAPRPGAGVIGTRMQTQRQSLVASPRRASDAIKSNLGLAARTQGVDRLAPVEVVASYLKDPADAMQTMYYMRTYGQRMSLVSQAASNGAPQLIEKTRKDGKKEWLIESQEGASLKDVMAELKTAGIKDSDKLDDLFTKYLVGRRAANVGWEKLNFDAPEDAKEQVQQARDEIKALGAETAFKNAAALYNEFNKGMLRFMVQTGALSQEAFDDLSKNGDYVPFYRKRNGNVDLVIGNEQPRRIGNMKDSPHLRELAGGDDAVLPFSASAIQNVSLLTDLAVRNVGTRNLAFEMATMGMGKIGEGDAKGTNIIPFKDKGVDKYIILDNEVLDDIGVPADLLVKGLAGIPVMIPGAFRLLALPSQLLRKAITLSPVYAVRQLFRDSTAAAIVSGANITPVYSAIKQWGKKSVTQRALEQRGITGGQVFTGTGEDLSKILRDMGAGKNTMRGLATLERWSMEADATTRRAQYDSYIKQGLSEMEATMMSLESMNFTRQGLSPSVYFAAQLVPFLNAQIQGLDVLYRAMTGKMPMNERLKIQSKMIKRGALVAATTLAYTVAMQDDEAYKNATPEERAMSWFVRVPGFDEPVRIPIPFEIGYIFKALPEAVLNLALGSQDGKATKEAVNRILINTLPGGSNMLTVDVNGWQVPFPYPVPTAFKPVIEANTGVSLFTRRPIVNGAQADGLVEYQYNERTSEIAKDLGKAFGMSPAIIENTVRGYLSGTGLAIMQAASMAYGDTGGPERAVRRLSELPLVGSLFQPNDGLALVNNVYDRLKEIDAVKKTYDDLIRTGERAEAERFLQERVNELVLADTAGNGRQMLNRLVQAERAVKASDMTGQEKRQQLDELRQLKIQIAASLREVLGTR